MQVLNSVAFSPHGALVASGLSDKTVQLDLLSEEHINKKPWNLARKLIVFPWLKY